MTYDFEPNKKHDAFGQITFAVWGYRLTVTTVEPIKVSCGGLGWIRGMLEDIYDVQGGAITLLDEAGDTLACFDDYDEGEDWLESMILGARLVLPGEAEGAAGSAVNAEGNHGRV